MFMRMFASIVFWCFLSASAFCADPLEIVDQPISWTEERIRLTEEYAEKHYGVSQKDIIPQAVVVHWTASDTWESTYIYFYDADRGDGTLNVASHFLVDRDGTIYRLTPETALNRHIIGYNWCAIGIENVGGLNGIDDLTDEQLESNIWLIMYIREKYPTIRYVFGHYQQDEAKESGLYLENVEGYRSEKIDPGPRFMKNLRKGLEGMGLIFFSE